MGLDSDRTTKSSTTITLHTDVDISKILTKLEDLSNGISRLGEEMTELRTSMCANSDAIRSIADAQSSLTGQLRELGQVLNAATQQAEATTSEKAQAFDGTPRGNNAAPPRGDDEASSHADATSTPNGRANGATVTHPPQGRNFNVGRFGAAAGVVLAAAGLVVAWITFGPIAGPR